MNLEQLIDKASRMKAKYGNLDVKLKLNRTLNTDIALAENSLGEVYVEVDYGSKLIFDPELNDEE